MWQRILSFLCGLLFIFLLSACSSQNPVVSILHEWGSQNPEFNPNAPRYCTHLMWEPASLAVRLD